MKKLLLLALLACAGTTAHAQLSPDQVSGLKKMFASKTWKAQSTKINGYPSATFEQANNIHNVDIFPTEERIKFSLDGTYIVTYPTGGSKAGIWNVTDQGHLIFNPATKDSTVDCYLMGGDDTTYFTVGTIKRLGLCSVTCLYEVKWVAAE